jgi:hypothetical protein
LANSGWSASRKLSRNGLLENCSDGFPLPQRSWFDCAELLVVGRLGVGDRTAFYQTERVAAARELAGDPDPRTGQALAKAVSDKDWSARAAAVEAIAKRGDPALLANIVPAISDKKDIVRYSAAAAVLRLSRITKNGTQSH